MTKPNQNQQIQQQAQQRVPQYQQNLTQQITTQKTIAHQSTIEPPKETKP